MYLSNELTKFWWSFKVEFSAVPKAMLRGDLLFVAWMGIGKEHEQDAEALLVFHLFLQGCKPVE